MEPFVSVILPAFNIRPLLELNLYSFFRQTYPGNRFEVIVVDDGSTDGTAAMCRCLNPPYQLKVVEPGANVGRARARNLGIARAEGELVIFCDGDTIQPPGFVGSHVLLQTGCDNLVAGSRPVYEVLCYTHYFEGFSARQREECFSLRPELRDTLPPGRDARLLDPQELLQDFAAAHLLSIARPQEVCLRIIEEMGEFSSLPIDWMCFVTRNVSLRKELLVTCGGFDESFRGWGGEDWDLGFRLKKQGAIFDCQEALINYHQEHPVDGKKDADARRNGLHMISKHNAPELSFLPGEKQVWSLYHYCKFTKQYLELKEQAGSQGLVTSFTGLISAIVGRQLGRDHGEPVCLDMLNTRRCLRRVRQSHREFVTSFQVLMEKHLEKTYVKFWRMCFDRTNLEEMSLRAGSLLEMLAQDRNPPSPLTDDLLQRWCKAVADEDKDMSNRRQAGHDLTLERLDESAPDFQQTKAKSYYNWTETLNQCMVPSPRFSECFEEAFGLFKTETRLTFTAVLAPFILLGRERANALSDSSYRKLKEATRVYLEGVLLKSLSHISLPTLDQQLAFFHLKACGLDGAPVSGSSGKDYLEFMKDAFRGGLQVILFEYPVLAKMMVVVTEHWARAVCRLLKKLADNRYISGIVLTPTKVFTLLFSGALAPKFMRSGVERSIELDRLALSQLDCSGASILRLEEDILLQGSSTLFQVSIIDC